MFDKVPPKNVQSAPPSPAPASPRPSQPKPAMPPRPAINPAPALRPEPAPIAPKKTPGVEDIFSDTDKAPASGKIFGTRQSASPQMPEGNADLFGGKKINIKQVAVIVGIIVAVLVAVVFAGWVITRLLKPLNIGTSEAGSLANTNPAASLTGSANSNANTGSASQTPIQQPALPADADGDGLTDDEEIASGTNISRVDTDSDGLTDKAEVKIYKTDPLNPDSDGDSFIDGQEVINGYDPLQPGNARLFDIPKE